METFIIALIVLGAVVVIVGILIALVTPVLSAALERRAASKDAGVVPRERSPAVKLIDAPRGT
jgi:hypothetical protein